MSSNAARFKYMIKFPADSKHYRFRFSPNLRANQEPQAQIQRVSQAPVKTVPQAQIQAAPQPSVQPPIYRLPFELITPIFAHIPYPSQISLGLTCKHLVHILEAVDLNLPGGIAPIWNKKALLTQLEGWMPRTHRLCSYCGKYRPMDGVNWKMKEQLTARRLRKGSDRIIYEKVEADLKRDEVCPRCWEDIEWDDAWKGVPITTRYGWRKRERDAIMEGIDASMEG